MLIFAAGMVGVAVVAGSLSWAHIAPRDPGTDVEEILALHQAVLNAHRAKDVEALLAAEADEIVQVSRGEVLFPLREERVERFQRYLRITEFTDYRDLIDPIVRVSRDGSLAWLIAQVHVAGIQTAEAGEAESFDTTWAWIELYEKRDHRWVRVGDVSNVKPGQRE
jgi:ketosteroid isomerase-like protein